MCSAARPTISSYSCSCFSLCKPPSSRFALIWSTSQPSLRLGDTATLGSPRGSSWRSLQMSGAFAPSPTVSSRSSGPCWATLTLVHCRPSTGSSGPRSSFCVRNLQLAVDVAHLTVVDGSDIFLVMMVLLNMFLAILNDAYTKTQEEMSDVDDPFARELAAYFKVNLLCFVVCCVLFVCLACDATSMHCPLESGCTSLRVVTLTSCVLHFWFFVFCFCFSMYPGHCESRPRTLQS